MYTKVLILKKFGVLRQCSGCDRTGHDCSFFIVVDYTSSCMLSIRAEHRSKAIDFGQIYCHSLLSVSLSNQQGNSISLKSMGFYQNEAEIALSQNNASNFSSSFNVFVFSYSIYCLEEDILHFSDEQSSSHLCLCMEMRFVS